MVPTAGFGLVSALPAAFWAAAALLMVSFCWTVVRWPGRWPVLGAHLLTLVVILHATPAIVYGTLRYSWAWKHVGVVDYIIHHGIDFNLGGVLGIYQGWPGFFALNAFLTNGGGLQSALSYAPWALVANDLLWLGPVLLIARAFTADWRMIWITAWVFELGNWVGQDYFSPQAFAYFLFLTVIAVCLRWLGDDRPRPRWLRAALARAGDWARGYAPRWLARSLPARPACPPGLARPRRRARTAALAGRAHAAAPGPRAGAVGAGGRGLAVVPGGEARAAGPAGRPRFRPRARGCRGRPAWCWWPSWCRSCWRSPPAISSPRSCWSSRSPCSPCSGICGRGCCCRWWRR